MNTVDKLKQITLELRKQKSPSAPAFQFHLSEIANIGKKNGNRDTTDDEAIRCVQKAIVVIDENIHLASGETKEKLILEKDILQSVLPQMASDEEVRTFLASEFSEAPANKGIIMKSLKEKFGVLVDMKSAGKLATEMFGL